MLAFILNEVVELVSGKRLVLNEGPCELLLIAWKDKMVEGGIVPNNVTDLVDAKSS